MGHDLLKGRRIIVTGCTQGIGLAVAGVLVEEGAAVCGFSRSMTEDKVKWVNEQGPGTFNYFKCDVSKRDEVKKCVDEAAALMGGIDVTFTCHGFFQEKKAEDITREDFETMFDTLFYGEVNLNQLTFPYLKESHGTIINSGSGAGLTPKTPGTDPAHYCAAKSAINMWTKKLAQEWAQYGITANVLNTMAWTESVDMFINTPEKIAWFKDRASYYMYLVDDYVNKRAKDTTAPYVVFLCTEGAKYITGQILNVDGGMVESR